MELMEDKKITKLAKFILYVWNVGWFAAVWAFYYNDYTFDRYKVIGIIASTLVYALIYYAFCNLYHAFRIASTSIQDTAFSQTVSFGVADLLLYMECCLINNNIVSILPGLIIAVLQILGTLLIVTKVKQHMLKVFKPQKTLLLYGSTTTPEEALAFSKRLTQHYGHLFEIADIRFDREDSAMIYNLIRENSIVLLYEGSADRRGDLIKLCTEEKKVFYFTPKIEDILCQGAVSKSLLDTPLMKYEYQYEAMHSTVGKRILDVVFSILFLLLTSPLFLIIAISIKLDDGGPVFYRQKRYTKNERIFEMIKFRSMVTDAEKYGATPCADGDPRITKVGRIIRATRLDEIPQFINILKGDMSFVGPRPERVENVKAYTEEMPEFAYRLRVKGGLTGYAQIYGKYNTSAYDKLRLDLMYIENQSVLLDIKIMLLTFKTIFQKESTEGFTQEESSRLRDKIGQAEAPADGRTGDTTAQESREEEK